MIPAVKMKLGRKREERRARAACHNRPVGKTTNVRVDSNVTLFHARVTENFCFDSSG